MQICATVSTDADANWPLNERLHWHFAVISFVNYRDTHLKEIYTQILTSNVGTWHEDIKKDGPGLVVEATFEFYRQFKFP